MRRLAVVALLVATSCGLGPSAAACDGLARQIREAEADMQAAAAQRSDLKPYLDAVREAREAAEAAGC